MTTTPTTASSTTGRSLPPSAAVQAAPAMPLDAIRRRGRALTAGTMIWVATIFTVTPVAEGAAGRIGDLGGLAFQLGVIGLLTVMRATGATGLTRGARAMLRVEFALLGLAALWSLLHAVVPSAVQDAPWLVALDAFWPLSMIGMFVIGVKVAFAGRWRGALRWWPLVAESWAFVTLPAMAAFGEAGSIWVGGLHLVLGYATLGVLLARRPELTHAA